MAEGNADVTVTWESLETYIANYTGRIKIQRLLHIANVVPDLRNEARLLLLGILRQETLDAQTYQLVLNDLRESAPELVPSDSEILDWGQQATRRAQTITDKLEQELRAYKNNLIKESIRMGQQDIAHHYVRIGDLNNALRAHLRGRNYCTSPSHMLQVNLNIVYLSILLEQWSQVQSHIQTIQKMSSDNQKLLVDNNAAIAQAGMHAAAALVLLNQKRYKEAGERLLKVEPNVNIEQQSNIVTMNDVANFTCLLALATFSRPEIADLLSSAHFKPYLELEVSMREASSAFYQSRYAECLKLLESVRGDLLADIYFAPHVSEIYSLIKERCLLQYIESFNLLPLQRIADVFQFSLSHTEGQVADLIKSHKLSQYRINLHRGLLVQEVDRSRQEYYQKVFRSSEAYAQQVEETLLYLSACRAGITVEPKPNQTGRPDTYRTMMTDQ